MNPQVQNDLTRTTLIVLFIGVLIVGSLWTMLPFLGALIWATTIVVATWTLMLQVQRLVGGSRTIATVVMTVVALAIFIVPFWFAIGGLIDAASQGADLARTYLTTGLGPPPAWLNKVPWFGAKIADEWRGTGRRRPRIAGCNRSAACRHDSGLLAGDHRWIRNGLRAFHPHRDHCCNSLFKG